MKHTNKQRKLVLDTEKIKVLDSGRLAAVAGGVTYTCKPSTNTTTTNAVGE
jgi:hypothetical protein